MPDEAERPRASFRHRRLAIVAAIVAALAMLALAAVAAFPFGMARGLVAKRLSRELGRPVTIAAMERVGGWSFHPVVAIRGLSAPQAAWAGPGELIRIREARIAFPALPLLLGRFRPDRVDISGLRLALARDAAGRTNWSGGAGGAGGGGARPTIRHLTIGDALITYRDAKRDRSFSAGLAVDNARGLVLSGTGRVQGRPVTIAVRGGAIDEAHAAAPWPFRVAIDGDAVGMTLVGRADRALDVGHFTAAATGHGADLKLLDTIIEAGLPATQPVRFAANVRRDKPSWTVTDLRGTIGRSDLAGIVTATERGGRHHVDATLTSNRFDFEDLSSAEGKRLGALKLARFGPRLVPDTPIDLAKLARTDGAMRVSVSHLLWPGSTPFRTLATTLQLDHSLLTADPLRFALPRGTMMGRVTVDQRHGGPQLDVALDVANARLIDILPAAMTDGDLRGHIRLIGRGRTIREAIGVSSGAFGFVARNGRIPALTAALLGEDLGGALTAGEGDATLRCLIARMAVTRGTARPAPLLIDTSRALSRASGSVDLASERLALTMTGAPKRGSLLRYAGTVSLTGTIKRHAIVVPRQATSAGGLLKMLGRGLTGRQAPTASDVDCDALARQALR